MRSRIRAAGFTLLEVLVAMVILVMALTIVWQTFTNTLDAWERGSKLLDRLHSGDFVLEQIVTSLRSAVYFERESGGFGFLMEDRGGGRNSRDTASWVTTGTALIPPEHQLANSVYRVKVGVDDNDEGEQSLVVWAWPHMAEDGEDDSEPFFISTGVAGIDFRTYNFEDEQWEDEWEDTNILPTMVEVTLFMEPLEKLEKPVKLVRLVEIPLGPAITSKVISTDGPAPTEGGSSEKSGEAPPPQNPPPGEEGAL